MLLSFSTTFSTTIFVVLFQMLLPFGFSRFTSIFLSASAIFVCIFQYRRKSLFLSSNFLNSFSNLSCCFFLFLTSVSTTFFFHIMVVVGHKGSDALVLDL